MRVIAGKFKGHRLVSFNASHIRPTTDRVKETLFNMAGPYLSNVKVLDLFSGTGSLGIEALSRDAEHVTFVEKNPKSIKIIKSNLSHLKIESGYEILGKNVLTYLKQYNFEGFDLILIDPPFTQKMSHDVMLSISDSKVVKEDSLIVIESAASENLESRYGEISLLDRRDFGDKILSFFKRGDI